MPKHTPATGLSAEEQAAWDAQPEIVDTKTMTPVAPPEQPKGSDAPPAVEDAAQTKLAELERENAQLREERENYKRATLAKEAEMRTLRDRPKLRAVEPEAESESEGAQEQPQSSAADDVIERKIRDIQGRANEQAALRDALDPSHTSHIPELVDRDQYATIIQYLPRNTDRSSPSLVLRALKSAVIAWKADTGRLTVGERSQEKNTAVSEPRSGSGKRPNEAEQIPQLPIRKPVPPTQWYT